MHTAATFSPWRRCQSAIRLPAGFQRERAARRPAGVHPCRAVPGHDRTRGLSFAQRRRPLPLRHAGSLPANRFASSSATEATKLIHALARVLKGAAHLRFHRRTGVQRIRAGLPPCRAGKQPLWEASLKNIGSGVRTGSLPAICWPGLPETRPRVQRCSGQSCNPSGLFPRPTNACPAGLAARPALDHRRGLSSNTPGRKPMCRSCADALQRRSTAFADQIPCLAGGAHRLSGGLGRTG